MPAERYYSFSAYLASRHGEALYRVPVDLGYGCPNRNPDGTGGCAFCAEDGGRARQTIPGGTPLHQAEQAMAFARRRYGASRFLLYIQAYTGTFAEPERLRAALGGLLRSGDFAALSIGTRPDCLPDAVLQMLAEFNERLDVWIELGVQTIHDATLDRLNRGHGWEASLDAIHRLHERGLSAAPHVIVGLPGEGGAQWRQTAERLAELPLAAIKIHNLHVIAGTALAGEYAREPFPVLDEHRYADALIGFLRRLPPDLPVMRLVTDTPPERLVAPKWSMDKGQFLRYLDGQMAFRDVRQGDLCGLRGGRERAAGVVGGQDACGYEPVPTDDGSVTFWSPAFKEHFHCKAGARTEAFGKFADPADLGSRLQAGPVRLLDICFGLGYNSLAACETARCREGARLEITALEIDVHVIRAAARCLQPADSAGLDWPAALRALAALGRWEGEGVAIRLLLGDARARLEQASASGPFDVVFLDAFSTQRNAELWTLDFFRRVRRMMAAEAVLVTYCAALPVRSALMTAGFHVGGSEPVGRRRGGTIAAMRENAAGRSIPGDELQAIATTSRGIPYRDPSQTWTNRQILRHREEQVRQWKTRQAVRGGRPDGAV
jgi:radical SAM protein (TIGR01212 family)